MATASGGNAYTRAHLAAHGMHAKAASGVVI
jgi:hypothetical protein